MRTAAKIYIGSVIATGITLLTGCLFFDWDFPNPSKYFGYLLLACIASTLKIKLPGIRGTMSTNFLFVLIGVTELSLTETVVLGCGAALVQCLWKPRKWPAATQVLFNMSALVTSF